jgi:hypothetical protein
MFPTRPRSLSIARLAALSVVWILLGTSTSIWFALWSTPAPTMLLPARRTRVGFAGPDGLASTIFPLSSTWREDRFLVSTIGHDRTAATNTQVLIRGHSDQLIPRAFKCPVPIDALPPEPDLFFPEDRDVRLTGWPMRSLWSAECSLENVLAVRTVATCSVGNQWLARGLGLANRALPTGRIWSGLIVNAVAFTCSVTCVWLLLARGLCEFRSALRRRRHLCPHCRYDLRATPPAAPCPECGHRGIRMEQH